ncbi:hypothetical protein BZG36_02577 [Bifiguratus adelaidae]|uniref:6-phosphogluconolactonase n=1 Tax=Bifiguratus adelaidae TaxID=1938954 RepID=A0A261Y101_9FUNG|nr:hypothetical protein BZG36_02577 [Bifiguratus adelaidae]
MALYLSTYTSGKSEGIYLYSLDAETGSLTFKGLSGKASNPSWIQFDAGQKHLYGASEDEEGCIVAFKIDETTKNLSVINSVPSHGADPCHLVLDKSGRHILYANYSGGSVGVIPINMDGSVSEVTSHIQHERATKANPQRQEKAHAHSINLDPSGKFAIVLDLGGDIAEVYAFDEQKGTLTHHDSFTFPNGAGPRHLTFNPHNPRQCFAVTELSNDVYSFDFDPSIGKLTKVQSVSAMPKGEQSGKDFAAEIKVHPKLPVLYTSVRGDDTIAIFKIDSDGKLTLIDNASTHGEHPRHFNIDNTGKWLLCANKDSGRVEVFAVDQQTGRLTWHQDKAIERADPVCVRFW